VGKGEGEADSPLGREPDAAGSQGPWDHDQSRRQTLHWLSHPGVPCQVRFLKILKILDLYINLRNSKKPQKTP